MDHNHHQDKNKPEAPNMDMVWATQSMTNMRGIVRRCLETNSG